MRLALDAGKDTAAAAQALKIRGVPLAADALARDPRAAIAAVRDQGLEVCQIGAFGYNPLHPDAAVLQRQTEIVRAAIAHAQDAGCRYIVINGGNVHPSGFGHGGPENFTDDALATVAERLKPLLALAEQHDACLAIEPYLKTAVGTPERFLKLVELTGSKALKINLDVTNFYVLADMWDTRPTIRRVCRQLAGHYGLVHIKDIALKEGFHIHMELAPITAGPTDWELVLREAAPDVPADSWVVLEHVASQDEARASTEFLRAAAGRAGVTLE